MPNNIKWDGGQNLTFSVSVKYDQIVERTAKRCTNQLRAMSPEGNRGKYKQGWTLRKGKITNTEAYYEVWNKTDWQLTWLLENGHLITNKRGGVGWASAKPHIQNALDFVKPQFLIEMGKAEIDLDIEKG